jgi:tripartite-type tricarboxylate transporter receptor subunit TctC
MPRRLPLIALATALVTAPALAQTKPAALGKYPDKTIRFLVPFAPGGTTDIIARAVGQKLSEAIGTQLVVDNRGGAGGTIAAETVARAAGDGYTMMMNHQGMAMNVSIYPKLPFDTLKELTGVALVGVTPNVLVVNANVPAKSVKEFIAYLKAKPGEIPYGSGGVGSSAHLAVELFQNLAGVKVLHVPYKGAGPALADTVGGQVQFMIATMPAAAGHIRGGRLRALGVSGAKRSPAFPDQPTIAEAGVPGYDYTTWYGIIGPSTLPKPMVQYWNELTNRAVTEPQMRERLQSLGLEVETTTPEKFSELIRNDVAKWGKIIKAAGIKGD